MNSAEQIKDCVLQEGVEDLIPPPEIVQTVQTRELVRDEHVVSEVLDAEQVDPAAYSLEGGMPSEAYVLDPRAADLTVYYSERGLRSDEVVFQTENEACSYLLDLVLSDDNQGAPVIVAGRSCQLLLGALLDAREPANHVGSEGAARTS